MGLHCHYTKPEAQMAPGCYTTSGDVHNHCDDPSLQTFFSLESEASTVTGGNCSTLVDKDRIVTAQECENAAEALNLAFAPGDPFNGTLQFMHSDGDPGGCIYEISSKQVYFNSNLASTSTDFKFQLMCKRIDTDLKFRAYTSPVQGARPTTTTTTARPRRGPQIDNLAVSFVAASRMTTSSQMILNRTFVKGITESLAYAWSRSHGATQFSARDIQVDSIEVSSRRMLEASAQDVLSTNPPNEIERSNQSHQNNPANRTSQTNAAQPTQPTQLTDPTNPSISPAQPHQAIQPHQPKPANPTQPAHSHQPNQPTQPTNSASSTNTTNPPTTGSPSTKPPTYQTARQPTSQSNQPNQPN
jgi:hypothetical protein